LCRICKFGRVSFRSGWGGGREEPEGGNPNKEEKSSSLEDNRGRPGAKGNKEVEPRLSSIFTFCYVNIFTVLLIIYCLHH
jgi:hypothetical protein